MRKWSLELHFWSILCSSCESGADKNWCWNGICEVEVTTTGHTLPAPLHSGTWNTFTIAQKTHGVDLYSFSVLWMWFWFQKSPSCLMLPSFCVTFLLITSYILPVSIFLKTLKTKNSKYLIFGRKWWSTLLIIHEKSIFHHLYGSILCKIEIQPFYLFHWNNYLKNFSQRK